MNWAGVVPLLVDRYRLLVPDLPGHAGSTPFPAAATLDPYADRLDRLAEREDMEHVSRRTFAGRARRVAPGRQLPQRVAALVLTASAGIRLDPRGRALPEPRCHSAADAPLLTPSRRVARSPFWRMVVFGYFGASDPPAMSNGAVDGFLSAMDMHMDTATARRALVRDDPRLDLERVACPVFLPGARATTRSRPKTPSSTHGGCVLRCG